MDDIVISVLLAGLILVPLAYKWELNLKIVAVGAAVIGLIVGLALNLITRYLEIGPLISLVSCVLLIVLISASALLIRFYRDPERIPPVGDNIIVAPADGLIKYIKHIEKGRIPFSSKWGRDIRLPTQLAGILRAGEGYLIGIGMTFLDVHVTRAAIGGKVTYLRHINGSFYSLKREDAPYRNERVVRVINNGRYTVGLVEIASRLVRRIVTYVKEGEELTLGQKLGMIKFGSQVDVLLPKLETLKIKINEGDQVYAGTSVIAEI